MTRIAFTVSIATVLSAVLGVTSFAVPQETPAAGPPVAAKRPVTDEYFGVKVVDDYRWLEDWSDPEVKAWSEGQNSYARKFLDSLPGVAAIARRVEQVESPIAAERYGIVVRGSRLFALEREPDKQQSLLVTLASADDTSGERVLLDPNTLDPTGLTTIDFFVPSLDGKRVAVSLSSGGTESGDVRVVDVATDTQLPGRIVHVNGGTAGGSVAWNADGTGFYYTRYPRHGERPAKDMDFFQQVYFHKLGTPASDDKYSIGKDFPRIAEISLDSSLDGRYVLATVANGDGGAFAHYLLGPAGTWTQVTKFSDLVTQALPGPDGNLYMLSHAGAARGKILRTPLDAPDLSKATTVVHESRASIVGFLPTAKRLYVEDVVGGPSQVRIFDLAGTYLANLPALPVCTIDQLVREDTDTVIYRMESSIVPPAWYRYTPGTGKAVRTALFSASAASFSDCDVVRETATSADGTEVPMTILRPTGIKLDGSNPTLLTGYGGFDISTTPRFNPRARIWLDQGGVWVAANIRGGGEFGEAWHAAGKLTKKQNVFDDFAACARHLIERGYTSAAKLAIEGGSNGGLLMGAMITQHPELFRAVVAHVALLDMLRFEKFPNGIFNVTEYGSVSDPEQFKAIYAYSPYQHVVDGTAYPACLFLTGANDPRVDPANSRKMVARLQAATSSKLPILLRTSATTGHIGSPLSARVAADTDVFAFLFHALGVTYKPVAPAAPAATPSP
jgi:prolyl oligopeptidase